MREELLNIKDRLAASEENYQALWKASRHLEKAQDEILNNVDNIILVHKTEAKNLTADMTLSRQKFENISTTLGGITDRVSNLELLMDMETSVSESKPAKMSENAYFLTCKSWLSFYCHFAEGVPQCWRQSLKLDRSWKTYIPSYE